MTKTCKRVSVTFLEVFVFLKNPTMRLLVVLYVLLTCVVRCVYMYR